MAVVVEKMPTSVAKLAPIQPSDSGPSTFWETLSHPRELAAAGKTVGVLALVSTLLVGCKSSGTEEIDPRIHTERIGRSFSLQAPRQFICVYDRGEILATSRPYDSNFLEGDRSLLGGQKVPTINAEKEELVATVWVDLPNFANSLLLTVANTDLGHLEKVLAKEFGGSKFAILKDPAPVFANDRVVHFADEASKNWVVGAGMMVFEHEPPPQFASYLAARLEQLRTDGGQQRDGQVSIITTSKSPS